MGANSHHLVIIRTSTRTLAPYCINSYTIVHTSVPMYTNPRILALYCTNSSTIAHIRKHRYHETLIHAHSNTTHIITHPHRIMYTTMYYKHLTYIETTIRHQCIFTHISSLFYSIESIHITHTHIYTQQTQ